jgi:hypothetical protein
MDKAISTQQQREMHKEKRRYKRLAELAKKLNIKCKKSARSLRIIDEVLERVVRENESISRYIDALRRAN